MLEENKKKILIITVVCIVILGAVVYYFLQNKEEGEYFNLEENWEINTKNVIEEVIEEKEKIVVHISGQVVNPGVISLEEGARLIDAINIAGGATGEADLSKVNLAYVLADAQKIYIPSIKDKGNLTYILEGNGDNGIVTSGSGNSQVNKEEKIMVNINTASEEELQKLSGIGSSIATKIVAYRKENGKFNTTEDIKNVSGIGDSKFEKIKNNICVK